MRAVRATAATMTHQPAGSHPSSTLVIGPLRIEAELHDAERGRGIVGAMGADGRWRRTNPRGSRIVCCYWQSPHFLIAGVVLSKPARAARFGLLLGVQMNARSRHRLFRDNWAVDLHSTSKRRSEDRQVRCQENWPVARHTKPHSRLMKCPYRFRAAAQCWPGQPPPCFDCQKPRKQSALRVAQPDIDNARGKSDDVGAAWNVGSDLFNPCTAAKWTTGPDKLDGPRNPERDNSGEVKSVWENHSWAANPLVAASRPAATPRIQRHDSPLSWIRRSRTR